MDAGSIAAVFRKIFLQQVSRSLCGAGDADGPASVVPVSVASGDPLALAAAVKREVQALDPDQPVSSISTMEKNIGASLAARRPTMSLLGAFAGLALVLASVGIYGVMALSSTQRTRELGIRLALGASRGDVLRLILGQGISLIGVGLLAGLAGTFAASRALNSLLYGVGSLDWSGVNWRAGHARRGCVPRLLFARAPRQYGGIPLKHCGASKVCSCRPVGRGSGRDYAGNAKACRAVATGIGNCHATGH